jgi:hypothetical protein
MSTNQQSQFKNKSLNNLQNNNIPGYSYGSVSTLPVAEQNQTYIAYFDGIGGTGPEILGQTAYFVKYLIDKDGNVTKPVDNTDPTTPSQASFYNLYNNFEPGKNAVVKLLSSDPTLTTSATGKTLVGKHKITGVGETFPVLVSEYGPKIDEFYQSLYFGPNDIVITQSVLDLNALWLPGDVFWTKNISVGTLNNWVDESFGISGNQDGPHFPSQSVNWSNGVPNKTIETSTSNAGTQIAAQIAFNVINNTNNPNYGIQVRLIKNNNTTNPIYTSEILSLKTNVYYVNPNDMWNPTQRKDGSFEEVYINTTPYFDLEEGDQIKVQFKIHKPLLKPGELPVSYTNGDIYFTGQCTSTFLRILQKNPVCTNGSIDSIPGANVLNWGFFNIFNLPYTSGSYSVLGMGDDALWLYYSGLTQNYTNQKLNYNKFTVPFGDLEAGDTIRVGYDKDNVYTIIGIYPSYYGLGLLISPQVSDVIVNTSQIIDNAINNFSITKLVKNGRYVVLDVDKPKDGIFFSGILQPEFISDDLEKNYDKIIADLTQKDLIN